MLAWCARITRILATPVIAYFLGNLFYADSVRKCLCMYDWKFARVDRALQLIEVDEAYKLPNYSYYYVYPFDCLKERLLHSEGVEKGQEIKYLYIPEH